MNHMFFLRKTYNIFNVKILMKISLTIEQIEQGYNISFKNDPLIVQFFKEISLNQKDRFNHYTTWAFTDYKQFIDQIEDAYYRFKNNDKLYYNEKPILTFLSIIDSDKIRVMIFFKGLIDVVKWQNDFQLAVKDFVEKIIKPYYKTKKYIESKGNKLVNTYVINKEGYSKYWFSYYRNYKKTILSYNEGLIAK